MEQYREELHKSEERLKELRKLGSRALSRYDIEITAAGDAREALKTAKWLVTNHIQYYRRLLDERPEQLRLF